MNDRYTYYDDGLGTYRILSDKKPWSLEYWDLVNIIGQLEDQIEKQRGNKWSLQSGNQRDWT